jgi:hypothetical protein
MSQDNDMYKGAVVKVKLSPDMELYRLIYKSVGYDYYNVAVAWRYGKKGHIQPSSDPLKFGVATWDTMVRWHTSIVRFSPSTVQKLKKSIIRRVDKSLSES